MILIDDAGWGSLVGGVIIGGLRETPGKPSEFTYAIIPVEDFQGENFENKSYVKGANIAAMTVCNTLSVKHTDEILVCTGTVLDGVCEYLEAMDFNFTRGKITGDTQDLIERALQDYLASLGFIVDYSILTDLDKKGLFWWQSINFLKGNANKNGCILSRKILCKTGWPTFPIWSKYPYEIAKLKAKEFKSRRSLDKWKERRSNEYN